MFASSGLLTGPLIQGRGGGFALGACSQVLGGSGIHVGLDYSSLGGIMVAHVSACKTAVTAAIGLSRFGERQVVHFALCCPLWLSSRTCGCCATRVALQLADDLGAVRRERAGHGL